MISVTNLHGNILKTKHKQLLSRYYTKTNKTNFKKTNNINIIIIISFSLTHTVVVNGQW